MGCFLSHRECLRRIAEGNEPWAAIFEDDVVLSSDIEVLLQENSWIPNTTDIVKLDTNKTICTLSCRKTLNVAGKIIKPYRLARLLSEHYGTGCYIISQQCAKKLLDLTQDINAPIDVVYFDPNKGLLHQLNIQQVIPSPVMQVGMTSTIEKGQKIKGILPLHAKLAREIHRIYNRNIKASWQRLRYGYYIGRIPFK